MDNPGTHHIPKHRIPTTGRIKTNPIKTGINAVQQDSRPFRCDRNRIILASHTSILRCDSP